MGIGHEARLEVEIGKVARIQGSNQFEVPLLPDPVLLYWLSRSSGQALILRRPVKNILSPHPFASNVLSYQIAEELANYSPADAYIFPNWGFRDTMDPLAFPRVEKVRIQPQNFEI